MRLFLEPTEPLLFRRTGKSFDAGESGYADTLFPPTPETMQGAIRAAIATHWDRTKTLVEVFQQQALVDLIGDRSSYGRFRITGIALGRRRKDGKIERLFTPPSHLLEVKGEDNKNRLIRLRPKPPEEEGVHTDLPESMQLVYPGENIEGKLESIGGWLTEQGLLKALHPGEVPTNEEMVSNHEIFEYESRLGIGMNNATKTTREGLLYQVRMVRMKHDKDFDYGFVVDIRLAQSSGSNEATTSPAMSIDDDQTQKLLRLPDQGWITLGGERRAAHFEVLKSSDTMQRGDIEQAQRGNLLYLATPAAFKGGWRPEQWSASLTNPIAAAINRYQSIGGWSLRPGDSGGENKSIRRCVPAGSVYFFDKSVTVTQPLTDYGWQIGYGIAYAGEW
jgi:CRISPR-associated protein Cmr3